MVKRLPSWVFIALALALMGLALFPIIRVTIGIDERIQIQFLTVIMLLIAGLMCGLTGMLLLVRRQPDIKWEIPTQTTNKETNTARLTAVLIHASGLLIFTGIPLANFLACYFLWLRNRHHSADLDAHGREAICQQITLYVYAMMCLFMALLIIGVLGLILLLAFHCIVTIMAIHMAWKGNLLRYPANIAIIDRRIKPSLKNH